MMKEIFLSDVESGVKGEKNMSGCMNEPVAPGWAMEASDGATLKMSSLAPKTSKVDGILEGPETNLKDETPGSSETSEYEVVKEAMENVELYFQEYVDSSMFNSMLTLLAGVVEDMGPMFDKAEQAQAEDSNCGETAVTAVQVLRGQLVGDLARAQTTAELKQIVGDRLEDLDKLEKFFKDYL